ncbi:MAG: CoA transferase [Acetobacteraceae bacterium]|nr:CoA transferase [Acetobacteraceae bacterium]
MTTPPDGAAEQKLPLSRLRVLDVTQVMAGPFCTMLLADLGADVIKVEPPGTGDQTRGAMGFKLRGNDSLGFLNLNRNKRSVTLDLKNAAAREAFLRLAERADVLVENYRPGVTKRLGIDYETLAARNPRLIYASISGFGQTGPWASRPGFDLMAQAMSGIMSVTGHPGGPPVKAGVPVADIGCALFATYAILSAYIGVGQTGRGQYIDASLFEAAMAFSIWDICDYWGTGRIPGPVGTANRMSAPYQAVRASDGYFVVGATNNKLWRELCDKLDRADLLSDSRFADIASRLANREALIAELERSFASRTAEQWVSDLLEAGIPAGRMNTYPEAFESPHGRDRQMRLEIEHPVEGTVPNIGFPVKLSGTPQQVRRHPPLLGEHTEEVLREAGFDAGGLEHLREGGAFGRG